MRPKIVQIRFSLIFKYPHVDAHIQNVLFSVIAYFNFTYKNIRTVKKFNYGKENNYIKILLIKLKYNKYQIKIYLLIKSIITSNENVWVNF